MTKLEKAMRRQIALTEKLAAGTITKSEKLELKKLNAAIKKATEPETPSTTAKTTLCTMKLKDFRAEVDKIMNGTPTAEELALAKKNIAAVKDQGVTDPEGIVAIEVAVKYSADNMSMEDMMKRMQDMETELAALKENGFDGRTNTGLAGGEIEGEGDEGDGEGEGEGTPSAKEDMGGEGGSGGGEGGGDMPYTTMAAMEALTAIIDRYQKIKDMIKAGETFTEEDLRRMWPGWELQDAVENATAVLAKLEALKALAEEVHPALEKIAKDKSEGDEGEGDGGGDGDGDGDGEGDGDDGDGNGDGDGDDGEGTEKSAKLAKWNSGGDLAPSVEDTLGDYGKTRKKRFN